MKASLKSREFKTLFLSYKSLSTGDLLFRYRRGISPRLGIIVSRGYGNAVKRNLFKRRCRTLFKSYFNQKNLIIVIQPLKGSLGWKNIYSGFSKLNNSTSLA